MQSEQIESCTVGPSRIDYQPPCLNFEAISFVRDDFPGAVIGANGAGKSSLLLALTGAIPAAIWADVDIGFRLATNISEYSLLQARPYIGVVPQRWEQSYLGYNIEQELLLCSTGAVSWQKHISRKLELEKLQGRDPASLSSGEKKRLMIAKALCMRPMLLITDEWELHLDADWKMRIRNLFSQFERDFGSSHLMLISSLDKDADRYISTTVHLGASHYSGKLRQSALSRCILKLLPGLRDFISRGWIVNDKGPWKFNLALRYSVSHRKKVELAGESGRIVEIVGPNGSGKTTVLRNLWKLSRPIFRCVGSKRKSLVSRVHFLQADPFYQVLGPNAFDELSRALSAPIKNRPEILESLAGSFEGVEGTDVLTLSYGERKLLALLSAVICEEPIVALDEPLAGLDFENISTAKRLIKLAARSGKIVILASQEPILPAESVCCHLRAH